MLAFFLSVVESTNVIVVEAIGRRCVDRGASKGLKHTTTSSQEYSCNTYCSQGSPWE